MQQIFQTFRKSCLKVFAIFLLAALAMAACVPGAEDGRARKLDLQSLNDLKTSGMISGSDEVQDINFVLLMDCSGSMGKSDEKKLYQSAARMFTDMLPTEGAKLAVVGFGSDYGDEAYPMALQGSSALQNRLVKVFYPLSSVESKESREAAKAAINTATESIEGTTYTPIGYALTAAVDILVQGGAADHQGAIILLSDGRVTGQSDSYNGGWDYYSIDAAADAANSHKWPIYCMELNEDGVNNDLSSSEGNLGRYQMRENIPARTGTEPVELSQATQAESSFADIFSRYYDTIPTIGYQAIQNGQAAMDFFVEEMVAETSLTLIGETGQLEYLELKHPDGTMERLDIGTAAEQAEDREISFEDRYIIIKLLTPENGDWQIIAHGPDGIELGLYAVSIRELNLHLTDNDPAIVDGEIGVGSTIDFNAQFIYHNTPYYSPTIYSKLAARLEVNGPNGKKYYIMEGTEEGYKYTLNFNREGEYTVRAVVHDDIFRTEDRYSEAFLYVVKKGAVRVSNNKPLQFSSQIGAEEGASEASLDLNLVLDSDKIPEKMRNEAGISGMKEFDLYFSDFFYDPDFKEGDNFKVTVEEAENSGAVELTESAEDHIRLTLKSGGTASYRITAVDTNDDTVTKTVIVNLNVVDIWGSTVLEISNETGSDTELGKGDKVELRAYYSYNGKAYTDTSIYSQIPAAVMITEPGSSEASDVLEMKAGKTGYTATVTLSKAGEYQLTALVHDDSLNPSEKFSEAVSVTVKDLPVTAKNSNPAQELNVSTSLEIDLTDYFKNPDGDPVTYTVESAEGADASLAEFAVDAEKNIITVTAGSKSGKADIVVRASDGNQDTPAEQTIQVTVVNQPLTFKSAFSADPNAPEAIKDVIIYSQANLVPALIKGAAGINGGSEYTVYFNEIFYDSNDPDGTATQYECVRVEESGSGVEETELTADHLSLKAKGKGSAVYRISAADTGDETISKTLVLNVTSKNVFMAIFEQNMIIVLVALAALAAVIGLIVYLIIRNR